MISFLTAIIVMVAIGTVVQRAEIFSGDDTDKEIVALVDDNIVVPANALQKLDIFANDTGISNSEKESLVVLSEPKCGRVLVRRGVLQYYARDDCVGEQQIIYTLEAMAEPQTAVVKAFVVSDKHPAVRPDAEPKVANVESPPPSDSPKVTPFGDDNEDLTETKPGSDADSEATARTDDVPANDDSPSGGQDLATEEPDTARTLPGRAPEAPTPGDATDETLVADRGGADTDKPAIVPDRPNSPENVDTGDGGTLALALVRPETDPKGPETTNTATLIVPESAPDASPLAGDSGLPKQPVAGDPKGASAGGDSEATAEREIAALSPSDKGNTAPKIEARVPTGTDISPKALRAGGYDESDRWGRLTTPPAGLNAGRPVVPATGPARPKGDGEKPDGEVLAAIDADSLIEGHPTGRVPIPVARSLDVGSLGTSDGATRDRPAISADGSTDPLTGKRGVDAERKVAVLAPANKRVGEAVVDARVPLGTDIPPGALNANGGGADAWDRLNGTSDRLGGNGSALNKDLPARLAVGQTNAGSRRDAGTNTSRPPRSRARGADRLVAVAPTLADDHQTIRHDTANGPARRGAPDKAGLSPRQAALSPELGNTPRPDLMNRSLEPDPVGDRPTPGAPQRPVGIDAGVPAAPKGTASPDAARTAALVRGDGAASYSFFTTLPKQRRNGEDRRTQGVARPAGSFVIDPSDLAPGAVHAEDARIAALPAAADAPQPAAVPNAALTNLPVSPDDVAPDVAVPDGAKPDGTVETPDNDNKIAALPDASGPCTLPPSTELEIRRAAQTVVRINAPCQAETVAELSYSGLRLAIPLDREGRGSVVALGFEASAAAIIRFSDEAVLDFDIPFPDVNRIERVAVVWNMPVALELHALEFGAKTGDQNHVYPGNQRHFSDVRRNGGGFLHGYRSYAGVGQNVQIYTHWKRRGAPSGVIKLMIDYASRSRDRLEGTCGDGKYAAPGFTVLRSSAGRPGRPVSRRLSALPCSRASKEVGDKRLISGAIDDLVIAN